LLRRRRGEHKQRGATTTTATFGAEISRHAAKLQAAAASGASKARPLGAWLSLVPLALPYPAANHHGRTMNFQGTNHSKLVQRRIFSPIFADKEFANITTNDDGYSEIPIVLVPRSPLLLSVALNVPSGPFVLWQKWHRNMGQLSPGVRWIWPGW
jgi:hypothetical protein